MNVNPGEVWFFDAKGEQNIYGQSDRIFEFEIIEITKSLVKIRILKDSYHTNNKESVFYRDIEWLKDPCYRKKAMNYNQYWVKLNE